MQPIAYGPHRDQVADLYLPATDGPAPLVVVLHGGFLVRGVRPHTCPAGSAGAGRTGLRGRESRISSGR
ncbi:hypothetical protein ACIBG0_20025 [Nocardia sp. NPDC050630]|uniref:hypothetical protein n=1 Tax=Nocardia sp. NPDC050630 TaxID=3364321 RepID=UPI00379EA09E